MCTVWDTHTILPTVVVRAGVVSDHTFVWTVKALVRARLTSLAPSVGDQSPNARFVLRSMKLNLIVIIEDFSGANSSTTFKYRTSCRTSGLKPNIVLHVEGKMIYEDDLILL